MTIRGSIVVGARELVIEPVAVRPGAVELMIRIKVANRDGQGLSITVPAEIAAKLLRDVTQQKGLG